MRTAIDTNVLSAILDAEPNGAELGRVLHAARAHGALVICGVVYAELLAYPRATAKLIDHFLETTGVLVDFATDDAIWREAGLRYARYAERRRRSSKAGSKRLLADFVVGAHAMVRADRLITLDRGRYAKDFPELTLV